MGSIDQLGPAIALNDFFSLKFDPDSPLQMHERGHAILYSARKRGVLLPEFTVSLEFDDELSQLLEEHLFSSEEVLNTFNDLKRLLPYLAGVKDIRRDGLSNSFASPLARPSSDIETVLLLYGTLDSLVSKAYKLHYVLTSMRKPSIYFQSLPSGLAHQLDLNAEVQGDGFELGAHPKIQGKMLLSAEVAEGSVQSAREVLTKARYFAAGVLNFASVLQQILSKYFRGEVDSMALRKMENLIRSTSIEDLYSAEGFTDSQRFAVGLAPYFTLPDAHP